MKNTLRQFWGAYSSGSSPVLNLIFLLFLSGVVIGAVTGSFFVSPLEGTDFDNYIFNAVVPGSFTDSFTASAVFILLSLFFGTSFLGMFLIPSVILVKAYSMSCSVAAMYSSFKFEGMLSALFSIAIPSLFILPCFLSCSYAGIISAQQLYSLRFHTAPYQREEPKLARHVFWALVSIGIFALYEYFIMPWALKQIF